MRALFSVYDKTGIIDFARELVDLGFELVSTGGTLATLAGAGLPVTAVAEVTGFPEILDGRVKTLHPMIHGGLLARLELESHRAALAEHGIAPISLVVGNLYPFESTIAGSGVAIDEAVEQIDIGGPAMLRAAAKNFAHVTVVVDPNDFASVLAELRSGGASGQLRKRLAAKAFAHVSSYDSVIADHLSDEAFPDQFTIAGRKVFEPRYGENPHQQAGVYRFATPNAETGVFDARQRSGKALSFNNVLDADAAWRVVATVQEPAACVVKHTIPCGFAVRPVLADAYSLAHDGDPVSAFGGIVALNRPVDEATARRLSQTFLEIVIAPSFTDEAVEILRPKKRLRVLEMSQLIDQVRTPERQIRSIAGGFLIQEADASADDPASWHVVTKRAPSESERRDAEFAWRLARYVKSNAIVIANDAAVRGVGAGQPNRLESVRIAVEKARGYAKGAALASDAYFPFPDGLEAAARAGVTCVVQPGGSIRDELVIAAADDAGIAMLFTGVRHFLH